MSARGFSEYLPIMAVKSANASTAAPPNGVGENANSAIPAPSVEVPIRRALSFDTTNTTAIGNTSSIASIISICDTSRYTVNPAFGSGNFNLKALKLEHWSNQTTLEDIAEIEFSGSFNIYDHACNAQPNLNYGLPSQLGTVTSLTINGTSYTPANRVFLNTSTYNARDKADNWADDSGDYVFLMMTSRTHGTNQQTTSTDSLDNQMANTLSDPSPGPNTVGDALAFGISDSDGAASSGQAPRLGWSRRNPSYASGMTNWQVSDAPSPSHSGRTVSGYFVISGIPR